MLLAECFSTTMASSQHPYGASQVAEKVMRRIEIAKVSLHWHFLSLVPLTQLLRLLEIYKTVLLLQASKLSMAGKTEPFDPSSLRSPKSSRERDLRSKMTLPRMVLPAHPKTSCPQTPLPTTVSLDQALARSSYLTKNTLHQGNA